MISNPALRRSLQRTTAADAAMQDARRGMPGLRLTWQASSEQHWRPTVTCRDEHQPPDTACSHPAGHAPGKQACARRWWSNAARPGGGGRGVQARGAVAAARTVGRALQAGHAVLHAHQALWHRHVQQWRSHGRRHGVGRITATHQVRPRDWYTKPLDTMPRKSSTNALATQGLPQCPPLPMHDGLSCADTSCGSCNMSGPHDLTTEGDITRRPQCQQ